MRFWVGTGRVRSSFLKDQPSIFRGRGGRRHRVPARGRSGYGIGSIQIDLVDGVDQQFDKGAYARF